VAAREEALAKARQIAMSAKGYKNYIDSLEDLVQRQKVCIAELEEMVSVVSSVPKPSIDTTDSTTEEKNEDGTPKGTLENWLRSMADKNVSLPKASLNISSLSRRARDDAERRVIEEAEKFTKFTSQKKSKIMVMI